MHLILDLNIIGASDEVLLGFVVTVLESALVALQTIRWAGGVGSLASAPRSLVAEPSVSMMSIAVGREFVRSRVSFAHDQFEERVEGRDAGGDGDYVGFDATLQYMSASQSSP